MDIASSGHHLWLGSPEHFAGPLSSRQGLSRKEEGGAPR